jgi:cell division protein FtsB
MEIKLQSKKAWINENKDKIFDLQNMQRLMHSKMSKYYSQFWLLITQQIKWAYIEELNVNVTNSKKQLEQIERDTQEETRRYEEYTENIKEITPVVKQLKLQKEKLDTEAKRQIDIYTQLGRVSAAFTSC